MEMKRSDDVTGLARRQLEGALAVLEAITEGSRKLQEAQLKAATEAHAAVEAMHKRLAEAGDGQDLWRVQADWLSGAAEKSLAHWHELFKTVLQTESNVARCLAGQLPFAVGLIPGAMQGGQGPLLEAMNNAYNRWMEATRELYKPASASASQPRQTA